MSRGLDYAWGRMSIDALHRDGADFVGRYFSHDSSKDLSVGELHALDAAGIDVVTVWETTANRALQGFAAGQQDAVDSIAHAGLRLPAGRPMFFAVDFDTAGAPDQIGSYFSGVGHVLGAGRRGAYGGIEAIDHLFSHGLIDFGWQTYAWSRGQWSGRAKLRQVLNGVSVGGVDCDRDVALAADFGQWRAPARSVAEDLSVLLPDELALVHRYDALAGWHAHLHPVALHKLRGELVLIRKKVWRAAVRGVGSHGEHVPAGWDIRHRRERYRLLLERTR